MSYEQREPEVRITARASDIKDRRTSVRMFKEDASLEATEVEIVRSTTVYAPTRSDGRRKPGTSDETTVEVLHTLTLSRAQDLTIALIRAMNDAAAYVPPGKGLDIAAMFGKQDLTEFDTTEKGFTS